MKVNIYCLKMADDFFDVPVNQIQEDAAPLPIPSSIVPTYKSKSPSILEDLAIEAYLKYLEGEVVAYISLTQTESALLRGVAIRMMAVLKDQLNSRMSGIASSSMRQKMLKIILSERFPSPKYCNIYIKRARKQNEIEAHRQHIAIAAAVAAVGIQPAAIALAGNMPPINQELNNPLPGVMDDPLPAAQAAALGIEAAVGAHNANPLLHNAEENIIPEDTEQVYSNCPNTCCTGAFIQEAMAGVIMSADIRELIFTSEQVGSRRSSTFSCLEFNIPVVLTHLLSATHQHFSQLERLIFSENFVKEDSSISSLTEEEASNRLRLLQHQDPVAVLEHQYRKQDRFARHFAAVTTQTASGNHNNVYCSADRKGLALGLLVMFRDVAPRSPLTGDLIGFYKLTEIVLKNNVQCELYSKANFQFELLARIGFCCPRLKVLDLFGTDTWADCLVAFFFRDAFHSLHRYLFFMENEEDEDSAYHPHDLTRYCQFCLDRLHPVAVERPFTINPVIPLIDPIYDHVIKKYPKRSYCILRNCVKVSDLIQCPKSTVYELLRPPLTAQTQSSSTCNVSTLPTCSENLSSSTVANRNEISSFPGDPLALSNQLCRTDTVRSDVIDETHDPSEYLIDDSCSNDDSTSSGTIEADTIRSRLRSATKSTCVIKSNRSRRNLKGTRQNQDRVYIKSKENVQFVKSTSQFKDSSSKAFDEKNEENQLQKLHKNWKKRSIKHEGDLENSFECSCSFKENQSKSNGIEEQALSKIINDDGVLTILPRDKTTRNSSISSRRDLGSKNDRHNSDLFLNNECFASSDKLILNDEKRAFRRSSRLIAKTLKSSKSSKKTKILNIKPKIELLREYLCENCANKLPDSKLIFDMPSLYKTGGSKNQLNNSIAQKLKPYKCQKCYAMQNTNAKCTRIYNSHVKLIETRTRSRKESKGMDTKSDNSIMTKNPSTFCLEENLYNEDIVMTRSMRKRKVRWIKRGKNIKKIGSNEPCEGKQYPSIELGSMEGSNILHEKKRARQSSKIENSELHVPSLDEDGNKSSLNEAPAKYNGYGKEYMYSSSQQMSGANNQSCSEIMTITFEEWQKEASNKWAAYSSSECDCSHWQQGMAWSNSNDGKTKTGTNCSQDRYGASSNMPYHARNMSTNVRKEAKEKTSSSPSNPSMDSIDSDWSEPKNVHYREISSWPHLNDCIQTLELLNIGGTNVLGEFIPFILLYAPRLKSLGQWINTMIYGEFNSIKLCSTNSFEMLITR